MFKVVTVIKNMVPCSTLLNFNTRLETNIITKIILIGINTSHVTRHWITFIIIKLNTFSEFIMLS